MILNPDSRCVTCANCIVYPDGDVDFLCSEDCMDGRLACARYRPRDAVPESRIVGIETAMGGEDSERVTMEMVVAGETRDDWYDFISGRSGSFQLEDAHYRLTVERREVVE